MNREPLPLDTLVAVRVGIETGDLGSALAKVAKCDDDADVLLRSIFEKVFYLGVVANVLLATLRVLSNTACATCTPTTHTANTNGTSAAVRSALRDGRRGRMSSHTERSVPNEQHADGDQKQQQPHARARIRHGVTHVGDVIDDPIAAARHQQRFRIGGRVRITLGGGDQAVVRLLDVDDAMNDGCIRARLAKRDHVADVYIVHVDCSCDGDAAERQSAAHTAARYDDRVHSDEARRRGVFGNVMVTVAIRADGA